MEAEGEEGSFALHALVACHKLDFRKRKRVAKMERSVHVGICHASKELWVLVPQLLHRVLSILGGTVDLPDLVLFPHLLVAFLDCNGRISFFGLSGMLEWAASDVWYLFELFEFDHGAGNRCQAQTCSLQTLTHEQLARVDRSRELFQAKSSERT